MHYLRHSNYKLGKLLPLGLICSIGMAGLIHGSAYADGPTATISMGDIVGDQNIIHTTTGSASFYVPITIEVENASAYTVSLWPNNASLCPGGSCSEGVRKINPVTTDTTLGQMPDDKWGYRYNFGDEAGEDLSKNYTAMPAGQSNAVKIINTNYHGSGVTSVPRGSETKVLTLGYGAAVASDIPAGNYHNQVTVSVAMQPLEVSIFGLDNMQDMTPEYCNGTTTPDYTATLYDDTGDKGGDVRYIPRTMLKDTRDDHMYIVEKLADGNCWMTENLALAGGTALTEANKKDGISLRSMSNLTSDYTLPGSNVSGFSDNGAQNMYNGTETAGVNANYIFGFSTLTTAQKTAKIESLYNTTSHTGGYYSWLTAVAGNKGGATGDGPNATEDICPKGWQLPTGQATTGDFTKLYNKYTNKTNFDQVWHIVNNNSYVGNYYNSAFANSATHTFWWSRTSNSATLAYNLYEDTSGNINPSNLNNRLNGFSIRCVVK